MTPMICLALLVGLWAVAAVFWMLDTPDPRTTAAVLLEAPPALDDAQYV